MRRACRRTIGSSYVVVWSQEPSVPASAADIFSRTRSVEASLGYSKHDRALDRLRSLGFVLLMLVPGRVRHFNSRRSSRASRVFR